MNELMHTDDFQINASELTAHKIVLANAEGELLSIAALRRLGINTKADVDDVPAYVWDMDVVARNLARLSVRHLVPLSWQSVFDYLCTLAREIDEAVWEYVFRVAVYDEERLIREEICEELWMEDLWTGELCMDDLWMD